MCTHANYMGSQRERESLLNKCDIVCANCHREIHAEMRNDQKA